MKKKTESSSPAVVGSTSRMDSITMELAQSDPIIIRALEDLMMVLLSKNVIGIDEIHPTVVETIIHRKKLRTEMKHLEDDLT